jgi:hypothetical protein
VRTPQGQKRSYQKDDINLIPLSYQQSLPEKTWNRYDSQTSKRLKVPSKAVGNTFKWIAPIESVLSGIPDGNMTNSDNNLSRRNNDISKSNNVSSSNNVMSNTGINQNRSSDNVSDSSKKESNTVIRNIADRQNLTIREITSLSKKATSMINFNKNTTTLVKPMTNDKSSSSSNKLVLNSNVKIMDITKDSKNRSAVYNNSAINISNSVSSNQNNSLPLNNNEKKTSWINTDLEKGSKLIAKQGRIKNSWVNGNAPSKGIKVPQKIKNNAWTNDKASAASSAIKNASNAFKNVKWINGEIITNLYTTGESKRTSATAIYSNKNSNKSVVYNKKQKIKKSSNRKSPNKAINGVKDIQRKKWTKEDQDFTLIPIVKEHKYCLFFNRFGRCRSGNKWYIL